MELKPASSSGAAQPSGATQPSGGGKSVSSIIAALNSQKELPIAMPVVSTDDAFQAKETSQTPASVSTIDNMSGHVVAVIQTPAEGESCMPDARTRILKITCETLQFYRSNDEVILRAHLM